MAAGTEGDEDVRGIARSVARLWAPTLSWEDEEEADRGGDEKEGKREEEGKKEFHCGKRTRKDYGRWRFEREDGVKNR